MLKLPDKIVTFFAAGQHTTPRYRNGPPQVRPGIDPVSIQIAIQAPHNLLLHCCTIT
ncbi:hypothetical protein [Gimesia maris]|uniref:hypothetical protein n=1 Tax=Gimesia maris TaxID=122 RepID=UPI0018DA242C|nr:hypothetical protein [Gimesia maris]|tara:strand:- start:420 stop:590 length:171 start_codon:yes stop_codon:yes gene_type:complete